MNFYLDKLTDEELAFLVKSNLGFYLDIIKQDERSYIRYSSQLGSKKVDSLLVQKNLPRIAVSLFRKKDRKFSAAIEASAKTYVSGFMQGLSESLQRDFTEEEVKNFDDEQIVEAINKYVEEDEIVFELLWIQLKLVGVENVDERKQNILKLLGIEDDTDSQNEVTDYNESDNDEEEGRLSELVQDRHTNTVKKPKVKKLTAEEKAAKAKAAIDAKERAKQEKIDLITDDRESGQDIAETVAGLIEKAFDESKEETTEVISVKEEEKVPKYIGVISIKSNFYNFTPIGVFQDGVYYSFSERELDELLPKSVKHNINFYYNYYNSKAKLKK